MELSTQIKLCAATILAIVAVLAAIELLTEVQTPKSWSLVERLELGSARSVVLDVSYATAYVGVGRGSSVEVELYARGPPKTCSLSYEAKNSSLKLRASAPWWPPQSKCMLVVRLPPKLLSLRVIARYSTINLSADAKRVSIDAAFSTLRAKLRASSLKLVESFSSASIELKPVSKPLVSTQLGFSSLRLVIEGEAKLVATSTVLSTVENRGCAAGEPSVFVRASFSSAYVECTESRRGSGLASEHS